MTPEEIRADIDQRLAAKAGEIVAKQAAYLAAHGRYWQGLCTHSVIPEDGEELPPDRAAEKPFYQAESWLDLGGLPETTMSALRIDTYDGPHGKGFVVVSEVMIDGQLWSRSINFGPETFRDSEWKTISNEQI